MESSGVQIPQRAKELEESSPPPQTEWQLPNGDRNYSDLILICYSDVLTLLGVFCTKKLVS